ncbi:MAG: BatD family protein [Candidatus Rariloculaceae bacterium]
MVTRLINVFLLFALVFSVSVTVAQDISLEASVDRTVVQENESFTYILRVHGSTRAEPDLVPLATDFDILQRSRNTSIQMTGGRTVQMTEWTLRLMPRQSGSFTLPPIALENALSNALQIDVIPAAVTSAAADIFLEVTAEPSDPYVQSQVVYTMTLYRGVGTGRSSLTLPEVSGGEAIIEKLGQDREYQTVLDGKNFIALERQYAIFPQSSGSMIIEPIVFEAMVVSNSGFSNVQRYRSEPLALTVNPAVVAPAELTNASWIPAQSLRLEERWSGGEEQLITGIPQTRTLTIVAEGILETQLPALNIPQSDSIRQYSDQPELGREADQGTIRALRTERFAVLAQSAGSHALAEIELPWFNTTEERWEIARIPAKTLDVLPGTQVVGPDPGTQFSEISSEELIAQSNDRIWRGISAGLLAAWLITLVLWHISRRSADTPVKSKDVMPPKRSTSRRLLQQIRRACDDNNGALARELLMAWGELRFPNAMVQSLGALAELLPGDLAGLVHDLDRCLYGPDASPWSGKELRVALAHFDSVSNVSNKKSNDHLLPLYQ